MAEQFEDELDELRQGEAGVVAVFARYQDRLRRMVEFRMDDRVVRRIDSDDVLQEAYLRVTQRIDDYLARPNVPFYVWARKITMQILIDTQRKHLGAAMRNVQLEVSLQRLAGASASSSQHAMEVAEDLTSPSDAALRSELNSRLYEALQSMTEVDREVLVLRHLEDLTNKEVAHLLGLDKSAASRRYIRALARLKAALALSDSRY